MPEVGEVLQWSEHPGWMKTVDCGPGWDPILENLHAALVQVWPDYRVVQVKEKFGGLRFYMESLHPDLEVREEVESLVRIAEQQAERTCDVCGMTGTMRNDGHWLRVRCDTHAKRQTLTEAEQGGAG